MSTTRNTSYLESRVRTASQSQLQLMLMEGAIRFGQQARKMWDEATQSIQCDQLIERALDIVEELVRSVSDGKTGISQQLEEQYAFIFRELAVCRLNHDLEKLESCLKLLEYQRETWKMACEWLETQPATPTATTTVPMPHVPFTSAGGFSIEA